jgi:membrane fusion protein, adhesin transport system
MNRNLKLKPEETTEQKMPESINSAADWARMRGEWARTQIEKMQAQADQFFVTDEDLPLSQHILLVCIALFFVVFILWANFAQLDEVTRGDGKVIPSSEVQILQSLEGGIVEKFLVQEGDNVKAGQPVMQLRDIQATSDLGANRQRHLALQAKVTRLRAEADGSEKEPVFSEEVMNGAPQSVQEELEAFRADQKNLQTQRAVLDQQLAQKQQEVSELTTRMADLQEVIRLARQERDLTAPLVERGSAPKMELLQLDRGLKERQTELNSLTTSLPRVKSGVEEAQARLDEIKSAAAAQAQTDLAAATAEMNTIGQTLAALEDRKTRTEIRSPVDGIVKDIKVSTVGGVVQPGADLIEIVPLDDQLIIEARIRPSNIAFLRPGQKAVVKITAYDFSIYGGLKGELVDISADTISNEKGEMFYRVRVRTPETFLKRKGEKLDIIPGMVASVDILTGKKTVMEYILKPFIKTIDKAMKER